MTNFLRIRSGQGGMVAALLFQAALSQMVAGQEMAAPSHSSETTEELVQRLTAAVSQAQLQMSAYQQQLKSLQDQLAALQQKVALEKAPGSVTPAPTNLADAGTSLASNSPSLDDLGERLAMQESQIATQELTKVETTSKFPLKVSGLVLFNAFVNTHQVDSAADPSYALQGGGSTGISLRQTVLGFDARGPHMFGATTHADLRADFFSNTAQQGYAAGLMRLRTAHAAMTWDHTEAFFQLDRPLLSPNEPTSLVATAQPELAWSGNLWTWNPQAGVSQQIAITESKSIKLQAALIDVADPNFPGSGPGASVSASERSRWPGSEARVAFAAGRPDEGFEVGAGGYFSPHETSDQQRYSAWAGTVDLRLPLSRYLEITGSAYRGAGLGGLGGGGFVDYVYQYAVPVDTVRPLDDVGGWSQLKIKPTQRFQLNGGLGIDNPFAKEIARASSGSGYSLYPGLVRNRSLFGNAIFSPSASLLFSLEYRRMMTDYIGEPANNSDVIGIGAGYRF
jgi:hypothetical protein